MVNKKSIPVKKDSPKVEVERKAIIKGISNGCIHINGSVEEYLPNITPILADQFEQTMKIVHEKFIPGSTLTFKVEAIITNTK